MDADEEDFTVEQDPEGACGVRILADKMWALGDFSAHICRSFLEIQY